MSSSGPSEPDPLVRSELQARPGLRPPAAGLPGLPGAGLEAGSGPAAEPLFDRLLAAPLPAGGGLADALARHRARQAAWQRDLLAPVVVPATAVEDLVTALQPADHALAILLTAGAGQGLPELRSARDRLLDDGRVELVGVQLAAADEAAPSTDQAAAVRALLEELDFTVPASIGIRPGSGWQQALQGLAADGAERLALPGLAGAGWLAEALRRAIDLDLTLRVFGGPLPVVTPAPGRTSSGGPGVLNLLGAVRAALNGAVADQLAAILVEPDPVPLVAAARRMSDADAAVVRAFLTDLDADPDPVLGDLLALGLISGSD